MAVATAEEDAEDEEAELEEEEEDEVGLETGEAMGAGTSAAGNATDATAPAVLAGRKRSAEEASHDLAAAHLPTRRPKHTQEWMVHCQEALDTQRAAEAARLGTRQQCEEREAVSASVKGPVPLYWKIDLPEVKKVLEKRGILPEHFVIVEHPHVTLLYLGASPDEVAAKKSELSLAQFNGMREALEALEGEEFEVRMTQIVIEERVACAVVSLPPIVPCTSKVPHVTLGTKMGVPPNFANEVLEDVKAGRTEGITIINLPAPRPLRGAVSLHHSSPVEE